MTTDSNGQKTHWRKIHDTEHLGSADIENMPAPIVFRISGATRKTVKNQEGKSDTTIAVSFEGVPKPMLCNVTNSQAIEKVTGSPYIEDWAGHSVELFVAQVNAFGQQVEAIRIKPRKPVVKITVTRGSKAYDQLVERIRNGETTIEQARAHVIIPDDVAAQITAAVSGLPEGM